MVILKTLVCLKLTSLTKNTKCVLKLVVLKLLVYPPLVVGYSHFNGQHSFTKVLFYKTYENYFIIFPVFCLSIPLITLNNENFQFKSKSLRASGLMYCEGLIL